jgi:proline dehydrogenase
LLELQIQKQSGRLLAANLFVHLKLQHAILQLVEKLNFSYREHCIQMLLKLVAEQEAFGAFLDDLKRAKDRTEFEQFMQERESRREGAEQRQGDKPGGAAGGSESKPG